jgi:hypothetical protein
MRALRPPFELVSPPDPAAWDALAAKAEGRTPFHTRAWARLWLAEWPDARWQAIVVRDHDAYVAALGFLVRPSPLGSRILSMPDGTYGGPLVAAGQSDAGGLRRGLLDAYRGLATAPGVLLAQLTWLDGVREEAGAGLEASEAFTLVASIPGAFDDALQWLPQPVRAPVRQAERNGLTMRLARTPEDLAVFHDLVTRTARRHGGRIKSLSFYRRMLADLAPAGLARFDLVERGSEAIAAGLHLAFGGFAMNWLLASDDRHWSLRPIHLLHARVLRELGEVGFREYDFGSSPAGAEGLVHFKEAWGGARRPVLTLRRRSLLHRMLRR